MKASRPISWKFIFLTILSIFSYCWIAFFIDRSHFKELISCFAILFVAYYFYTNKSGIKLSTLLTLGILFRLLFLFSLPSLSDDYFRFLWDGHLLSAGINPFDFKPSDVMLQFPNKELLLSGMNSPSYYTIYPPLAQFFGAFAVSIFPKSIYGAVVLLRLPIFLAELGTIYLIPKLLSQLHLSPSKSLLYVLNPLVIVELVGNLHFEAILIFFLLLAIYLMVINKNSLSTIPWALAAASKLIPFIFLPIFIRKFSFKKGLSFYFLIGLLFVLLWIPFVNASFFPHFLDSLSLYFQSFEFNASFYYLIREIGEYILGYNPIHIIGPWMSRIALVGILIVLLYRPFKDWPTFFNQLLFVLTIYYAMALIVHPWYICTLIFLSVFSNYKFPLIWSALIVLSYATYSNSHFNENYYFIILEYGVVYGWMAVEITKNIQRNKSIY